jgi:serine/threonine protein kinase
MKPGASSVSKNLNTRFQGRIVLGRYRINSKLAQGGMSSVYLARDMRESGLYAVKVLRRDLISEPHIQERFFNESRAVSRIDHPAVIRIYDVGKTGDGRICLVMEYIHGTALRMHMKGGPLAVDEVLGIVSQVADGLHAAHAQSVVHRDLKPENVLIPNKKMPGAKVKVIDFGIARIIDTPRITTQQHIMGTPQYIAPEQATDKQVDHRADIYALGVMTYEMLTGQLPFDGKDPETLLEQHVHADPPPLQAHFAADTVSPDLCDLVMECLSKDPNRRPSSMAQFRSRLPRD